MPERAISDIQVAQKACILVGLPPIQSFEDQNAAEATVLNTIYEDIVRDCLTATRWNFAASKKDLGPPLEDSPLAEYSHAYHYLGVADDVLQINTVWINGDVATYDINEDMVLVDAGSNSTVTLGFTKRVQERFWPPFFMTYVIFRLAGVLAASITRQATMAETYDGMAERQLAQARSRDAQQVTSRGIRLNRLIAARRGG